MPNYFFLVRASGRSNAMGKRVFENRLNWTAQTAVNESIFTERGWPVWSLVHAYGRASLAA